MRRFREVREVVEKTDLSRFNRLRTGGLERNMNDMLFADDKASVDPIDALPDIDDPGDEIDNLPDFVM